MKLSYRISVKTTDKCIDMKYDLSILFYLRKKANAKNKKLSIYLRITLNKDQIEFSVKRTIEASKWDSSAQKIKGRGENVRIINNYQF